MKNFDTVNANKVQWSDVSFVVDATGIQMLINADAIKASIYNILNTRVGERPMRRGLGAGIEDHIFDLMDEDLQDFFTTQIKKIIEQYDDRVSVQDITYNTDPNSYLVTVVISYLIPGFSQTFNYSQTLGAK